MSKFFINDEKWAEELQRDVENYMDELQCSIDEDESLVETESGAPFCGCNVCYWREILFYLSPRLLKAAAEGKIELEEPKE